MLAACIITHFVAYIQVNFKFQFHIMNVCVCVCYTVFSHALCCRQCEYIIVIPSL